jgi:hypothetical protein
MHDDRDYERGPAPTPSTRSSSSWWTRYQTFFTSITLAGERLARWCGRRC